MAAIGRHRTAVEELLDALVRHQIGILRIAGGIGRRTNELLDVTEKDLRRAIRRGLRRSSGLETPAAILRMQAVLAEIEAIRSPAWRNVRAMWRKEMLALAGKEAEVIDGLVKTVVPTQLNTKLPSAERLRAIMPQQIFLVPGFFL